MPHTHAEKQVRLMLVEMRRLNLLSQKGFGTIQDKIASFSERETNLIRSTTGSGWGSRLFIAALLAVFGWGVYAYIYQLQNGLVVTAMREYVSWGLYTTNFVFFIGIWRRGRR